MTNSSDNLWACYRSPSYSLGEVAQTLSRVIGRPYQYVEVLPSVVQAGMEQYGVPAWMIAENVELFAAVKAGLAGITAPDFATVTGRTPTDLSTFFADHRVAFGG